jgi:transposase
VSLIERHRSAEAFQFRGLVDDRGGVFYALRNRIERCFNRLKNARRVVTRYEKLAETFAGFVPHRPPPLASAILVTRW